MGVHRGLYLVLAQHFEVVEEVTSSSPAGIPRPGLQIQHAAQDDLDQMRHSHALMMPAHMQAVVQAHGGSTLW